MRGTLHIACAVAVVVLFSVAASSAPVAPVPQFTEMVVFGDSLSDTGNLGGIWAILAGYQQHDDRFTCGPSTTPSSQYGEVWHEVLAHSINLTPATKSDAGGMNYAHGDATTGDGTANLGLTDNVGKQLAGHLSRLSPPDPDALYVVFAGGNDLVDAAGTLDLLGAPGSAEAILAQAARNAVGNLEGYIRTLATQDSARTVLWPNLPDLSKVPRAATFPETTRTALASASAVFKLECSNAVARLRKEGVFLYEFDVYAQFEDMLSNPAAYGFENTTGVADGSGAPSADTYVFWDAMHPTSIAHHYLGQAAFATMQTTVFDAACSLTTGSPAGISHQVATDPSAFLLAFIYEFETTTGELTVTLGDTVLTRIPAPDAPAGETTIILPITDPSLLAELLVLDFTLDGPQGSSILLDNITMPGLLNGHFEPGDLESWTTTTPGQASVGLTVEATIIPEPTTLLLLTCTALAILRRKKRSGARYS